MTRVHIRSAATYSSAKARAAFPLNLIDRYGEAVTATALYASIVVIYTWFGGMK